MKIKKLSLMPPCVLDKEEVFNGDVYCLVFFKNICNKDYSICYSSDDGYFAVCCDNKYSTPMSRKATLALVKRHRSFIKKVKREAKYLGIDGRSLWTRKELNDVLDVIFPMLTGLILISLFTLIFAPLRTILVWIVSLYILFR